MSKGRDRWGGHQGRFRGLGQPKSRSHIKKPDGELFGNVDHKTFSTEKRRIHTVKQLLPNAEQVKCDWFAAGSSGLFDRSKAKTPQNKTVV